MLVRLIRGKSSECSRKAGQDFPRGVLASAGIAAAKPVVATAVVIASVMPAAAGEVWRIHDVDQSVSVHLRQQPSNRSKILAYIPVETRGLAGGECKGDWCRLEYKGLEGWVHSKYLAMDENEPPKAEEPTAKTPETAASLPKTSDHKPSDDILDELQDHRTLKLAKRDGPPVPVYAFPNEKLPIAGHLSSDVETVETLLPCVSNWCYVRSGSLVGWLRGAVIAKADTVSESTPAARSDTVTSTAAIVRMETGASIVTKGPATAGAAMELRTSQGAAVKPQTSESGDGAEQHALNKTTTTATQTAMVNPAIAEAVQDTDRKTYSLAGLTDDTLALREAPDDKSPILSTIPRDAKTIEGMQKCDGKWCLVRYGSTTGWVLRRHLADESLESSQAFQVSGVALWSALDVFDAPGSSAAVVGRIPSYATGIVPIGRCDKTWCHIRYLGIAGWVDAQYLAPLAR